MFEQRSSGKEIMDDAAFDWQSARDSFRLIALVNRWLGGTRVVRNYLLRLTRNWPRDQRLKILDLGSGICDIPLALADELAERGIDVSFDCLEINPHITELALRNISVHGTDRVRILQQDVFDFSPADGYDFALASMFFHHLPDSDIVRLVEHVKDFTRHGLLINDLHRSFAAWCGVRMLTSMSAHVVRHDAALSVLRGFRRQELSRMLAQLPDVRYRIYRTRFARIAVELEFDGTSG